jgi:hypothetical protein
MLTGLLAIAATALTASPADARLWVRTTCLNPDQSAAPSDGWTGFATGTPSIGSTNKATCGPGDPMVAFLSMRSAAPAGGSEVLQYTPPDGSVLVGGRAFVALAAEGSGVGSAGIAAMYTPAYVHDASNVFLQCVKPYAPCQNGLPQYGGEVELPRDRGGNLYLAAVCGGVAGSYCSEGGSRGAWSAVALGWANLRLATTVLPTGADFHGSLLEPAAHGTASLAFTAADGGPGVHKVTVTIDAKAVYDATPDLNAGKCAPVGYDADAQAFMWAWQQPCARSQPVDLQIDTTRLRDGEHELTVVVTNAGANTSTVLRRTITTKNRTTVSAELTSDKAPAAGPLAPVSAYSVVLDRPTQALRGGFKRTWPRSALRLSGTLRNSAGVPAPGVRMTLFIRNAGEARHRAVAQTTTDASGHWVLGVRRGLSRTLVITYGEQPDPASARAIKIRQTVTPAVSVQGQALGGLALRFSGRVTIHPLGSPRPFVSVQVYLKQRWRPMDNSAFRVDRSGAYAVNVTANKPTRGKRFAFRVVVHSTPRYGPGISPTSKLKVI